MRQCVAPNSRAISILLLLVSTAMMGSRATESGALDDVEPDAASAKDGHALPGAHFRREHCRANAGRNRAAHQRRHFQRHILAHRHDAHCAADDVFGEGAKPGEDVNRLALPGNAAAAIA